MLVVGKPTIKIENDACYKVQEVATFEDKHNVFVNELIITKEAFIECYNKWIKDGDTDDKK